MRPPQLEQVLLRASARPASCAGPTVTGRRASRRSPQGAGGVGDRQRQRVGVHGFDTDPQCGGPGGVQTTPRSRRTAAEPGAAGSPSARRSVRRAGVQRRVEQRRVDPEASRRRRRRAGRPRRTRRRRSPGGRAGPGTAGRSRSPGRPGAVGGRRDRRGGTGRAARRPGRSPVRPRRPVPRTRWRAGSSRCPTSAPSGREWTRERAPSRLVRAADRDLQLERSPVRAARAAPARVSSSTGRSPTSSAARRPVRRKPCPAAARRQR